MATMNIFVSFEYEKDKKFKGDFIGQAKTQSPHRIKDSSLREAYPDQVWQQQARNAIEDCDVIIVLVGEDTHNAPGVKTEIRIARRLRKPILQVVRKRSTQRGFKHLNEPIQWKWKLTNAKLDAMYGIKIKPN